MTAKCINCHQRYVFAEIAKEELESKYCNTCGHKLELVTYLTFTPGHIVYINSKGERFLFKDADYRGGFFKPMPDE